MYQSVRYSESPLYTLMLPLFAHTKFSDFSDQSHYLEGGIISGHTTFKLKGSGMI